jgi:predicted transcriptional regulator
VAKKRTYEELRLLILKLFKTGQKTVNEAATESGINWRTVDNHIIYLTGKGYINEVFSSRYVRIYEITERGIEALKKGGKV